MKKIILFFILLWVVNCEAQGWQNCGDGVTGNPYPDVYGNTAVSAMAADTINNILYVSGTFDTINNSTFVPGIAKWNGTIWSSIPALDSVSYLFYNSRYEAYVITAMIMFHGSLYLPASFTYEYNNNFITDYYVLKYDGHSIQLLPYLDGEVNCFTIYKDTLYIGGDFVEPDTVKYNHIAKWNGVNWQPVGKGFTGYVGPTVYSLGVYNNKLYAGGFFDQSGNNNHLFSIAQWNDTAWVGLGKGVADLVDSSREGSVKAIGFFNNKLYAGGDFGFAGGDSSQNIALWDGSKWVSFNKELGNISSADITSFQTYRNKLYIGGTVGINLSIGIISWDENSFEILDSGVSGFINSLTVFQNSLYVGGSFFTAGNINANRIASWSPTAGINDITDDLEQIIIYPNPFSEQTTLRFSQPITKNAQLTLYDLTGREVENYFISSGAKSFIIKRNNLPAGMYFYKVAGNNTTEITGKIVIE